MGRLAAERNDTQTYPKVIGLNACVKVYSFIITRNYVKTYIQRYIHTHRHTHTHLWVGWGVGGWWRVFYIHTYIVTYMYIISGIDQQEYASPRSHSPMIVLVS